MTCWHLTLSSKNREPIFPVDPLRRSAVRNLAKIAGNDLVLFDLGATKINLITLGSRARAARVSENLLPTFRPLAAAKLQPTHLERINSRSHLLALTYTLLDQPQPRRAPSTHPALQTGSCFADLVGARYLPDLHLRLLGALPHITRSQLFTLSALPADTATRYRPSAGQIRSLTLDHLIRATAAALLTFPSLEGSTPAATIARRCFAKATHAAGFSKEALGATLRLPTRKIPHLVNEPVPPPALHAVLMRIVLEISARSVAPNPQKSSPHRQIASSPAQPINRQPNFTG